MPADQAAIHLLATRRSSSPDLLGLPGPNAAELAQLIDIGLRVPDHGRLSPWRLIVIQGEAKERWLAQLATIAERRDDAPKARVTARKLQAAPLAIVVVSSPIPDHKVPEWEQMLSAGAVSMNLLNGAAALGFGANWLTGWHAYDEDARKLLSLGADEKVAGVVIVGTAAEPTKERERARADQVVSWLDADL